MKSLAAAILCLALPTLGANVTFNLTDFLTTVQPLQKKTVLIEPQSTPAAGSNNTVVVSERRYFNLGTNASFVATNMIYGYYRCSVWGPTYTSVFRIYLPTPPTDSYASDLIVPISSDNPLLIDGGSGNALLAD